MRAEGAGIEYTLVRSRRRTAALVISTDAVLTVRAPLQMPLSRIEILIGEKIRWINRKILEQKARPSAGVKQFVEGERFLYLGHEYGLRISDDIKGSFCFEDGFVLSSRERARAKELFVWWYKREARRIITERVALFAQRDGFRYQELRITGARRRWGSCSAQGSLSFSWRPAISATTSSARFP